MIGKSKLHRSESHVCTNWLSAVCSVGIFLLCLDATVALAEDKRSFSLINPTPDRLLRDMTTDRPDITEVPFTVDAGRVQIESTVYGFARSRPDAEGSTAQGYELLGSNVRIGLTHDAEATVIFQPYASQKISGLHDTVHKSGIGAVVLRAKFNLWGNDTFSQAGATALALLPYVSLPTNRSNGISPEGVDGGLFTFYAIKLDGGFSLGINAGIHSMQNIGTEGRHFESSGSASLGYEWSEKLTSYLEVATRIGTRDPLGDIGIVGGGIAYRISPNFQIDAGVNFGVTRASDRFAPFAGISARF
jgi:hypothetical protein